jgi:heparan-alpha-glucosaminide N-acetyltransferase
LFRSCGGVILPAVARVSAGPPYTRIASVDAYRGLVMFLMLAEVFRTCDVAAASADSRLWRFICNQQTHAGWVGCSLHDLIQPGFYFLVGIGLVLSMARRMTGGQTFGMLARHTMIRALILMVLGMALVAVHPRHWTWTFVDTLTQIGLAYPFLFLIALLPKQHWYLALGAILIGYWSWFAWFPLPATDFDYSSVAVPAHWLHAHGLSGFAAHWQKNSNAAWAFDRWFLNLFPGNEPYSGNENGLTTLNFIPSIGTMVLGLIAGDVLQTGQSPQRKLSWLFVAGFLLVLGGWALGALGVCPVVKAIWTPSWVLFSGGWCFLFLSAFYAMVDVARFRSAVFPLTVIGMNSVVAYSLSHLYPAMAFNSLRRVFGSRVFHILGGEYEPALYGVAVFLIYWLILYVLYRLRVFVRV